MASAPAWQPKAAGSCSPGGEPRGASACRPEPAALAPSVTAIGRLKTRAEFLHVRGGERYTAPSLVLQARRREGRVGEEPSLDPHVARFGFTATKTLGGAVVRNRARRRLKEAVRLAGGAHAVEGYDYVLIAREGTVQRPFPELIKDLERALAKVHAPKPAKKR